MGSELERMKEYLQGYDGLEVNLMEVCGSHTAAISKLGIPALLSEKIHLLSGPGCPVCVTPTAYIDRLIELSLRPNTCVCTFGDLIRVPGSGGRSLSQAKGEGAQVRMVYSPMDTLKLAEREKNTTFVFAAVGFETTAPTYALLMDRLTEDRVSNVKLLTALKTMPAAIDTLCRSGAEIHGFLAPGHVSVITGSRIFQPLARKYQKPFVVAGFQGGELLAAIYVALRSVGQGVVHNLYPAVVTEEGNLAAQQLVKKYFEPSAAVWRGMGEIPGSGLLLREEYAHWDAGSGALNEDNANPACQCGQVLTGKIRSNQCPLFGKACTPLNPQGACMVSTEGSCFQYYTNHREK